MKNFIFIVFLSVSSLSVAQDHYLINVNTEYGKLNNIYIYNKDGIFKLNSKDKLEYVIIGNYENKSKTLKTIKHLENETGYFKYIFSLKDTKFYTKSLNSINYPDIYSQIEEKYKELPIEINGIAISYYTNYYDNENQKGKIKSIGKSSIEYFTEYYADDEIRGKIKKIGNTKIELADEFTKPELKGSIIKLNDISITYYYEYYKSYLNGKIKNIGAYIFDYFSTYGDNPRNGKFKKLSGEDSRFDLITL